MTTKIVMFNDPEAAHYITGLKRWVSRVGSFHGDGPDSERRARYAGCTHVQCERCGAPTPKEYRICDSCREVAAKARYDAMPRAEWDGTALLYSEAADKYYTSPDDAEDDLKEGETLADLRLVICEPRHARKLTLDYFSDDLPEDGNPPVALEEVIYAFNESVADIVLSWFPGKKALKV